MTTRAALVAAIEAVERATERSRDVDIQIWKIVTNGCGYASDAPHYTTSLDAALTLVPEGWGVQIEKWASGFEEWVPENKPAIAQLCRPGFATSLRPKWPEGLWVKAFTPALALCLAALRARLALLDATPAPNPPASPTEE